MRRPGRCAAVLPLLLSALASCETKYPPSEADARLFGAKSMRIHPTFTRVKDWTGDGKPDGIEAVVELQDEFGEPTRGTGSLMFELYTYQPTHPDPRGRRVPEVWVRPIMNRQEQVAHWSRALRAYSFRIPFDPGRTRYVLAATFERPNDQGRLFDQIVLEPPAPERNISPATAPAATAPSTAPSPPQ